MLNARVIDKEKSNIARITSGFIAHICVSTLCLSATIQWTHTCCVDGMYFFKYGNRSSKWRVKRPNRLTARPNFMDSSGKSETFSYHISTMHKQALCAKQSISQTNNINRLHQSNTSRNTYARCITQYNQNNAYQQWKIK